MRLGVDRGVRGADGDAPGRRPAAGRGHARILGGGPGPEPDWCGRPGVPAVRVLRAGLDRGLAGPGDVAGPAAAAGGDAGPRARGDRGGVFDAGQSRTPRWSGSWRIRTEGGTIVIGEYERAFYGSQYALMAPLFEHYGIGLWMPEVGGRVDWHAEDHEQAMLALGLSSKREITRTRIRVRTAMAAQTREQGRYLGGRPPCGYRLADAGSHPNKAHAAWGRRAHRLEPDPVTAPVVRWMFAQQLAGHSAARITRALNDAGVPCPSAARTRPGTRTGRGRGGRYAPSPPSWRTRGIRAGRCGTGSAPTSTWPTRLIPGSGTSRCSGGTCPKAGSSPGTRHMRRWSARPISSPSRTRPRRAASCPAWPSPTRWPTPCPSSSPPSPRCWAGGSS